LLATPDKGQQFGGSLLATPAKGQQQENTAFEDEGELYASEDGGRSTVDRQRRG
jgi:hypothetical protein